MTPMVQKQFATIRELLKELRTVLETNQEEVQKQHAEKEELLQGKWRERKELTTLRRISDDYEELDKKNERLQADKTKLGRHLKAILRHTRALQNSTRP